MTSSPTVGFLFIVPNVRLFLSLSWFRPMPRWCSPYNVCVTDNLAWVLSHLPDRHRVYTHVTRTIRPLRKPCPSLRIRIDGQCSCRTPDLLGMGRVPLVRQRHRVRSFSTRQQWSQYLHDKSTQPRRCIVQCRAVKRQHLSGWFMCHRQSWNSHERIQCLCTSNNRSNRISPRRNWSEPIRKVTRPVRSSFQQHESVFQWLWWNRTRIGDRAGAAFDGRKVINHDTTVIKKNCSIIR